MTTREKARLIEYANYCRAKAESSRRSSRQQSVQFVCGWLAGSGQARKDVADELMQYIDVTELLESAVTEPKREHERRNKEVAKRTPWDYFTEWTRKRVGRRSIRRPKRRVRIRRFYD